MFTVKTCQKCGEQNEFSRSSRSPDGLQRNCKVCVSAYMKARYAANRERFSAEHLAYEAAHREEARTRASKWYAKNKARAKAAMKAYRKANAEALAAKDAAWYQANAARRKRRAASWRRANPAKSSAYRRKDRARRSESNGTHTDRDIARLFDLQRGKCAACRNKLLTRFHVDHITALKNGGHNGRTNLQLLCANCNLRKHAKDPIAFMQMRGFLL